MPLTSRAALITDVTWMDKRMRDNCKKLGAVGMTEAEQGIKGKVSIERRYSIVSAGVATVEQFAHAARARWGVETMHWVLDVVFREDDCHVRKRTRCSKSVGHPQIRALGFAQRQNSFGSKLAPARKLAVRRPNYRLDLLGQEPCQ